VAGFERGHVSKGCQTTSEGIEVFNSILWGLFLVVAKILLSAIMNLIK
jgi:hypothetical protein